MKNLHNMNSIHVNDLNLWAHVGVLERENLLGQSFVLNFSIWLDLDEASINDDLSKTVDYSLAVREIQKLSSLVHCFTIEHFSEEILKCLESLYGKVPMKILLTKCNPPIDGFNGTISVEKARNIPS